MFGFKLQYLDELNNKKYQEYSHQPRMRSIDTLRLKKINSGKSDEFTDINVFLQGSNNIHMKRSLMKIDER